jgi:hypothetical protein
MLPRQERIEICFAVKAVFLEAADAGASLGFENPPEVTIRRVEFRDPGDLRGELV